MDTKPDIAQSYTGLCCCCLQLACPKTLWAEYSWMISSEVYGVMLRECFGLEFPRADEVETQQICEVCITRLRSAYKFRRQVAHCWTVLTSRIPTVVHDEVEVTIKSEVDDEVSTEGVMLDIKSDASEHQLDFEEGPEPDAFIQGMASATDNEEDSDDEKLEKPKPDLKEDTSASDSDQERQTVAPKTAPRNLKRNAESRDETTASKPKKEDTEAEADDQVQTNVRKRKLTEEQRLRRNARDRERRMKGVKKQAPRGKAATTAAAAEGSADQTKTQCAQKEKFKKQLNKDSRLNACLLLQYSTIYPFKVAHAFFNCFYCSKHCITYDELTEHCSKVHWNLTLESIEKCIGQPEEKIKVGVSNIVCKICTEKVANIEKLIEHLVVKHDVKFNYDYEPKDAVVGYDLENGKFRCSICQQDFVFFKTLTTHMNEHSPDHVCETCGKCFLTLSRLNAHTKVHTGKSTPCPICFKMYASEHVLNHHLKYVHDRKSFACSFCEKTFKSPRLRLDHQVEAHGRKRLDLKCDICSKEFVTNNGLRRHKKKKHLGIIPSATFECEYCGMEFQYKQILKDHIFVHTGEKNQECNVCHKKFSRLKSLKEHLKIHNNDKRWSCAACAQAFVQKCSLRNHIKVHHSDSNGEDLIVYTKPGENKA